MRSSSYFRSSFAQVCIIIAPYAVLVKGLYRFFLYFFTLHRTRVQNSFKIAKSCTLNNSASALSYGHPLRQFHQLVRLYDVKFAHIIL